MDKIHNSNICCLNDFDLKCMIRYSGKIIKAGNHFVNIANPQATPAIIKYIKFDFLKCIKRNKIESSIKNKKYVSIWSVATLPADNSIIKPLIDCRNAAISPIVLD